MVNFTVDQIRTLMDSPINIRNLSVIAHVDHGKSTLTDSLIAAAGIIAAAKAGDARFMDTRPDEQERTITIKSTAVSLHFALAKADLNTLEIRRDRAAAKKKEDDAKKKDGKEGKKAKKEEGGEKKKKKKKKAAATEKADEPEGEPVPAGPVETVDFLINLIDSPGHVDFSSEVTAALRVTDGALVVVDCVEGVCVQTETVLRQAIAERIKPVLFVNKLDRVFLELMMEPEDCYQMFSRSIESVNVVIATYLDEHLGDVQVYPEHGTVGFGSGLQSWGFTLTKFAKIYAAKYGIKQDVLMTKLWGNNFWNHQAGKFTSKQFGTDGTRYQRAFCQFILDPIIKISNAVINNKMDIVNELIEKLAIPIKRTDRESLTGKPLLKTIMRLWLPASESLLEMIVNHLPSPAIAQAYRYDILYSGPADDESSMAIKRCDASGPLMMYVSKMVPTSEKGRFFAFGRVFSGIIATGQTVRIYGNEFVVGGKKDLYVKKIQRTVLMMGRFIEQLTDCPAGNIVGLVGVDQYLIKSGTITTCDTAHPFVTMKYSVSPVVRVAVEITNQADRLKLINGLKQLSKSDPLVVCTTTATGENIIAGAGELHLEICIKDLRDDFMKGAPIKVTEPVVSFCETITKLTDMPCVSKSPNKHNRLTCLAEPMTPELVKAINDGDVTMEMDVKKRCRYLIDNHQWGMDEARKIWTFGCPPDSLANVLVDNTKGVQFMNEIKDSCVGAFLQATQCGIYCEEILSGFHMRVEDVTMHADAIHRGAGQIMQPMKRVLYACQIKSGPGLLEPMYICDITVPTNAVSGVYQTLNARRGVVESTEERPGTPLCKVKAFLPVLESFGFTNALRANTSGQAFPQLIFSHWQLLNGSINDEGTPANLTCLAVRTRKGLKAGLPKFSDYYDKI